MVGLISFYKMVGSLFLILDVLYIGQHLRSRGITEIRTPMAPPQEGARVAGLVHLWQVSVHQPFFLFAYFSLLFFCSDVVDDDELA